MLGKHPRIFVKSQQYVGRLQVLDFSNIPILWGANIRNSIHRTGGVRAMVRSSDHLGVEIKREQQFRDAGDQRHNTRLRIGAFVLGTDCIERNISHAALAPEFRPENFVHRFRICLAARRFHDLPYKKSE